MSLPTEFQIHFKISLTERQAKWVQEQVIELGYGFDDAGPIESAIRFFEGEALDRCIMETCEDVRIIRT